MVRVKINDGSAFYPGLIGDADMEHPMAYGYIKIIVDHEAYTGHAPDFVWVEPKNIRFI